MKKLSSFIITILISFEISAQFVDEMVKIVANDWDVSAQFGYSVSINGNHAIVGSLNIDADIYGDPLGSAYILERNNDDSWEQVQKFSASDQIAGDHFGFSVSISGIYAIVGAPSETHDASGANGLFAAGSAYIFERNEGCVWNHVQKIVAPDRHSYALFGWDVSMNGNNLIVRARNESHDAAGTSSKESAGAVYFSKSTSTFIHEEDLHPNLAIYPNPAKASLVFDITNISSSVIVELYDLQGKKVLKQKLTENRQVSVSSLPKGLYLFKVNDSRNIYKGKIAVE
jgi:hypothetical protein